MYAWYIFNFVYLVNKYQCLLNHNAFISVANSVYSASIDTHIFYTCSFTEFMFPIQFPSNFRKILYNQQTESRDLPALHAHIVFV